MALPAPALAEELRPVTLEDILELESDAGEHFEIIGGELIVSPTLVTQHQDVLQALSDIMSPYVRRERLGKIYKAPVTVRLSRHDVVQPDLLYLPAAKRALLKGGIIDGVPDLVVEILSPSTQRIDLVKKRALYERSGVSEYWVVDIPSRRIRLFRLDGVRFTEVDTAAGELVSQAIPGLVVEIPAVFADLWE